MAFGKEKGEEMKQEDKIERGEVMKGMDESEWLTYHKACEKILLQIIKQMSIEVFSKLDIERDLVYMVFTENGISTNKIDKYFH